MTGLVTAIYARVSTQDQDCSRQVAELSTWAARCDWPVALIVREHASGAKDNRNERRAILEAARRGTVKQILVSELSRWSRSVPDLLATLTELANAGCSIRALNGLDMDLSSPIGRLLVVIIGGVAEFERSLIADRTRSGIAVAKAQGTVFGRRKGFRPTDAKKANVLALRGQGYSLSAISKLASISVNSIRRILAEQATG